MVTKAPDRLASLEVECLQRPFWPLASLEAVDSPRLLETTSLKNSRQDLSFDKKVKKRLKFDFYSKFVTSDDLIRPRNCFFSKTDVESVILIYNL